MTGVQTCALPISLLICFTSCNNKPETDSKEKAEKENKTKFDSNAEEQDASFFVDAVDMNFTIIALSKIAASKTNSKDLKALVKEIQTDHKKMVDSLKQMAQNKIITIPVKISNAGKNVCDRLDKYSGLDFDKEYCNQMIACYNNAITKFETEAVRSEDPEVRKFALAELIGLKENLEKIKASSKK